MPDYTNILKGPAGIAARMPGLVNSPMQMSRDLVGRGFREGLFDPLGSPRLKLLRRRRLMQLQDAARRRTGTFGQLAGLDPMQMRQAGVQADIAANQGLVSGLSEADMGEESSARDYLRSLFSGELDYARNRQLAKDQAKANSQGGMGAAIGAVGGKLLSKWLP